jgi:hypothetical protein
VSTVIRRSDERVRISMVGWMNRHRVGLICVRAGGCTESCIRPVDGVGHLLDHRRLSLRCRSECAVRPRRLSGEVGQRVLRLRHVGRLMVRE